MPAARLDAQAAKAYPLFDTAAILPPVDRHMPAARFDVDVHRIVTHATVPETGEHLKISGLLAVPVGAKGELPMLAWQHGTILSFDQVPSNLTRLADPAYELTDLRRLARNPLQCSALRGPGVRRDRRRIRVAGTGHRATFLAGMYGDDSTPGSSNNVVKWFQSFAG